MRNTLFLFIIFTTSALHLAAQDLSKAKTKYLLGVEKIESTYTTKKDGILKDHENKLGGIVKQFQQRGNLQGVMATRRERELIKADAFVSLEPGPDSNPVLILLRKKLAAEMRTIEHKRKTDRRLLFKDFSASAERMIATLTQQGKIEKALELKKIKEEAKRAVVVVIAGGTTKKEGLLPNGGFDRALDGWGTVGKVTLREEHSLGTGRIRKFARLEGNGNRSELRFDVPKTVEKLDIFYTLSLQARLSPDFKPEHRPPSTVDYMLQFGTRYDRGSSSSSVRFEKEKHDGEWHEIQKSISIRAGTEQIYIRVPEVKGYIDVDDITLVPR